MDRTRTELQPTAHRDSFVLRIWRVQSGQHWRGWIQHSRTGESSTVDSIEALLAFVEDRIGKLDGPDLKGLK